MKFTVSPHKLLLFFFFFFCKSVPISVKNCINTCRRSLNSFYSPSKFNYLLSLNVTNMKYSNHTSNMSRNRIKVGAGSRMPRHVWHPRESSKRWVLPQPGIWRSWFRSAKQKGWVQGLWFFVTSSFIAQEIEYHVCLHSLVWLPARDDWYDSVIQWAVPLAFQEKKRRFS